MGRRLGDARRVGYPYVVLLGKKSAVVGSSPLVELHMVNEDRVEELSPSDLLQYLQIKLL